MECAPCVFRPSGCWLSLSLCCKPRNNPQSELRYSPGWLGIHSSGPSTSRKTGSERNFGIPPDAKDPVETIYGPHLAQIVRCDLGQSFELNLNTSEYTSALYPHHAPTKGEISAPELETPMQTPGNPIMRIEIKTNDTGERKEMYGHIARHVITTRTQTPLEGSHSEPQESVTSTSKSPATRSGPKDGKVTFMFTWARATENIRRKTLNLSGSGNQRPDLPVFPGDIEKSVAFAGWKRLAD